MTKLSTNVFRVLFMLADRSVAIVIVLFCASANSYAQSTMAPPAIGQETKGKPAVVETSVGEAKHKDSTAVNDNQEAGNNILGNAKITESRRASGQIYLIELEHSSGAKQYIEETDSDGKIESTSNDIEETPNLPKWKLGSW